MPLLYWKILIILFVLNMIMDIVSTAINRNYYKKNKAINEEISKSIHEFENNVADKIIEGAKKAAERC